jgi:hypothetical protein
VTAALSGSAWRTARRIDTARSVSSSMCPPRALFLIFLTGQAKFRSITSYPRSCRIFAAGAIVAASDPMICPATGWSSSFTSIEFSSPLPPLTRIVSSSASVTAYAHPLRRATTRMARSE